MVHKSYARVEYSGRWYFAKKFRAGSLNGRAHVLISGATISKLDYFWFGFGNYWFEVHTFTNHIKEDLYKP